MKIQRPFSLIKGNLLFRLWFDRRIGRWLTPVKPLIPLLKSLDSSSTNQCNFTMKTVPWAMKWVTTLNIRLVGKVQGETLMLSKFVLTKNKSRGIFMTVNRFNEIKLFRSGNKSPRELHTASVELKKKIFRN